MSSRRTSISASEDPQFPPLLKGHPVKVPTQPLAHACRLAQSGELGAGDVVWSRNTARAELAIVLEPEVRLERALQMGPLMMVALGDCIGSLSPPKVAIHYRWPSGILLNGSVAGEVRLAAPKVSADAVPEWLVVGAELEIAAPREERQDWSRTSLGEEAGPEITRTDVLRSLAAHFLTWLNTWQDEGFRPVHDQWLFRAEGREAPVTIAHTDGQVLGLDESANLLLETGSGEVRSLSFLDCVDLIEKRSREP
jgi:BirA family transcriptional regulator, biotin operon repressor / biotin---[acetyl-CoA-carboxylase] ligase